MLTVTARGAAKVDVPSGPMAGQGPRQGAENAHDLAWRVHNSQEAWAGRVDMKASIVLAFEGVLLVVTVFSGLAADTGHARTWEGVMWFVGIAVLVLAVVLTCAAILPSIGSPRRLLLAKSDNHIFFGHLRHSSADELAGALGSTTPQQQLVMLSRQIVAMSRLNWWKYRLLQVAIVLTATALLALTISMLSQTASR
jgi:hypothetical protein